MIGALINLIIYLLVIGILMWLVYYVVDAIPIPQPLNKVIKIAVVVVVALIVILLLLDIVGMRTGLDLPAIAPKP